MNENEFALTVYNCMFNVPFTQKTKFLTFSQKSIDIRNRDDYYTSLTIFGAVLTSIMLMFAYAIGLGAMSHLWESKIRNLQDPSACNDAVRRLQITMAN